MRQFFLIVITVFGITAAATSARAQTPSDQIGSIGTGSDPLTVPTSSLPTQSSFSSGSAPANSASGLATATGSTVGSAGVISAPSSNTSQVPLQLSGETPNTSTQAAASTAASNHSSSTICPPPVPTSDGGSANLTEMIGGSLSGC
jgi:hypothetical protein